MKKYGYLILFTVILSLSVSAQIEFNDSSDIQFRTGLDMNSNAISGLPSPSSPSDAVRKSYVDAFDGSQGLPSVLEFNSTANQTIYMDSNQIVGLPDATADSEPITLGQIGEDVVNRSGDTMTGNLDMDGNSILNAGYVNVEGNVNLTGSGDPVLNYRAYEGPLYGMFLRYNSQFGGDTNDNRLVLGTENNGNEYLVLTAEREGSGLNLHRDVKVVESDNFVVEQPNDPRINVTLQEHEERGAFFRYDSNFSGDTGDNRAVIGTKDSGNEYLILTADRDGNWIDLERPFHDSIDIRRPSSGNPVLDYQLQEGDDYGAFVRYDSQFGNDSSDNRLVIGTENSGNDYEVLSAERAGSWAKIHRDTNISGDLYIDGSLSGVSMEGSQGLSSVLEQNNTANQSIEFDSSNGVQIGNGSTLSNHPGDIAIGKGADAEAVTFGPSPQPATVIGTGARSSSGKYTTAIGQESFADSEGATAIGAYSTADSGVDNYATALGYRSSATARGAVALGYKANAPNNYEATFGNLQGEELDINITGNATVHGNLAVGSNTNSGLGSGDINASDIYYDTLTAKSPVVQCSAGTSWCKVSEPSKQSSYFVKVDESFEKDSPRETAVEVVETDVDTIERFEELREENQDQEEKIEDLNSTVQALKSAVCEDNPEEEVCK